jgi:hypothetical protein
MTERTKSWLKDNVMGIVLAAMFTAFWVGYESDRQDNIAFRQEIREQSDRLNDRQQTVAMTLYLNPHTPDYYRDMFLGWIKVETRGSK